MQNKWIKNHFIVAGGVIICLLLSCSTVTKRKYNYSSELETLYRLDLLPDFRSNCIVASVIVILIVAAFLKAFRDSKWVSAAFYGLRPASTALVAAAGISVVPIALLHSGMTGLAALNWPAIALAVVLLVCTNWVPVVKKWHPIVFIGISALVGVLLKF